MNLRKLAVFAFVAVFLFAGLASAEWKSLSDTRGPAELQVKVLSSTDSEIKIEVTVPGYNEEIVKVRDEKCLHITVPGSHELLIPHHPALPVLGKMLKIHDYCHAGLEVVDAEEVEIELSLRIAPSKGNITRNIDPSTVSHVFGEIYKKDVFWPKEAVKLGKPFLFRDLRGVHLCVTPFRPNHVQMKMKVLKKFVAVISCEGVSNENTIMRTRGEAAPSQVFSKLYENTFANYTAPVANRDFPGESGKNLVLVYPDQFKKAIQDSTWYDRRTGQFTVTEVNLADIGSTKEAIQAKLQDLYKNEATRPTYVILFGDTDTMPTCRGKNENAASDRVYVRLAGNDNIPDAFISRFSGSADEIQNQLDKIVAYEDATSGNWLTSAVLIGSQQGSPTDQNRMLYLEDGGSGYGVSYKPHASVDGGLKGFGYNSFTKVFLNSSGQQSDIANAINNGVSVICYCGHGSKTSWASSGFNNNNIANLTNSKGILPVIWSVACVNGDFSSGSACFAETWLRKANGGAVAMEASSTNEAWVPPCYKQAGTIEAFIKRTANTFGALESAGVMTAFAMYGDADSGEANQLVEQCNLFGDCTMEVKHP